MTMKQKVMAVLFYSVAAVATVTWLGLMGTVAVRLIRAAL